MSHLTSAIDRCVTLSPARSPPKPHPVMKEASEVPSRILRGAMSLFGLRPPTDDAEHSPASDQS